MRLLNSFFTLIGMQLNKKKYFTLFLILVNIQLIFALPTLSVYLNLRDCATCNNYMYRLKEIKIQKNIFVLKSDSNAIMELLANYELPKNIQVYYLEDNFFTKTKQFVQSYCLLRNGFNQIDSFSLSSLPKNISSINSKYGLEANLPLGLTIPDSIKFSTRTFINVNKNILTILDYTLNKNVTFILSEDLTKIEKVIQIKGTSFKSEHFNNNSYFNAKFYNGFYNELKAYGKHYPQLERSFITDSTINMIVTLPYPWILGKDTAIGALIYLYQKNFVRNKSQLLHIEDIEKDYSKAEHYLSNVDAFFIDGNTINLSVFNIDEKKERFILANFKRLDNQLIFNNYIDKKIQQKELTDFPFINTSAKFANTQFYYYSSFALLYNIKSKQFFNAHTLLTQLLKTKYFIIDVIENEQKDIEMLVECEGKLLHLKLSNGILSFIENLALKNIKPSISIKFNGKNSVFILDNDNRSIRIIPKNS